MTAGEDSEQLVSSDQDTEHESQSDTDYRYVGRRSRVGRSKRRGETRSALDGLQGALRDLVAEVKDIRNSQSEIEARLNQPKSTEETGLHTTPSALASDPRLSANSRPFVSRGYNDVSTNRANLNENSRKRGFDEHMLWSGSNFREVQREAKRSTMPGCHLYNTMLGTSYGFCMRVDRDVTPIDQDVDGVFADQEEHSLPSWLEEVQPLRRIPTSSQVPITQPIPSTPQTPVQLGTLGSSFTLGQHTGFLNNLESPVRNILVTTLSPMPFNQPTSPLQTPPRIVQPHPTYSFLPVPPTFSTGADTTFQGQPQVTSQPPSSAGDNPNNQLLAYVTQLTGIAPAPTTSRQATPQPTTPNHKHAFIATPLLDERVDIHLSEAELNDPLLLQDNQPTPALSTFNITSTGVQSDISVTEAGSQTEQDPIVFALSEGFNILRNSMDETTKACVAISRNSTLMLDEMRRVERRLYSIERSLSDRRERERIDAPSRNLKRKRNEEKENINPK
ncbi:hypothetical protein MAR_028946 [Mya arenaria]|uniref:Uncharacterized protein n=1 Tax=Mya arenaria TaxID=6604 RepID=A0ABY7DF09_MYAAR|nr:hypothetical protein MAR_028946 [Mya arenaria]